MTPINRSRHPVPTPVSIPVESPVEKAAVKPPPPLGTMRPAEKAAVKPTEEYPGAVLLDLLNTVNAISGPLPLHLFGSMEFAARCRGVTEELRRRHPQVTFPALIGKD